jgi:hypothetical protein
MWHFVCLPDVVVIAMQGDYRKPRPALVIQSDLFNVLEQAVEGDGRPQTAAHRLTARRSADYRSRTVGRRTDEGRFAAR